MSYFSRPFDGIFNNLVCLDFFENVPVCIRCPMDIVHDSRDLNKAFRDAISEWWPCCTSCRCTKGVSHITGNINSSLLFPWTLGWHLFFPLLKDAFYTAPLAMPMSNPQTTTPDAASRVVKVTMNKQNLLSIHVSHNDLFEILTLYGACPSVMAHFLMRFLFFSR